MSRKFHVNERAFLNVRANLRAYVIAYVEDTSVYPAHRDEFRGGGLISLRIADCHDEIELDFDLSDERARANSLYKARKLAEVLDQFRAAIEAEAEAIEQRTTTPQHARALAAIH